MPMMATTERSRRKHFERDQGAETGRGQAGKNCERVDIALVEHAQHDIDGENRGQDQRHLTFLGILEQGRGP